MRQLTLPEFSVSTPIDEFVHPDSGSVIDVVSTIHVGSPDYYERLHDYLHKRAEEGFVICEEAISEPSAEEVTDLGLQDKLKHRLLMAGAGYLMRGIFAVEDSRSFTSQAWLVSNLDDDRVTRQRVNVDLNETDYANASGYVDLMKSFCSSYTLFKQLNQASQKGPTAYDQAIYDLISRDLRKSAAKQANPDKRNSRAEVRNKAVLAHVDRLRAQDAAARLALVWGFGHRRGLTDGIEQRGYYHKSVRVLTVALNPARYSF